MIDPILSLAISMHSNPGVYALLLGSGVSRSAGIPTGWEVLLDLIRQLSALQGEDPEPNPEAWYANKYGHEPNYSKLLDALAKSSSERSQLLRHYFEASDDEREEGRKIPTQAHRAIGQLVKQGYVRVILTTNFDRLLEQGLNAAGISPTIIASPDAAEGALPITHSKCTLIKLHGDYLDTRIKNTHTELGRYDKRMNNLLDRVLDEFGLVVCGWSAEWDTALRRTVERCKSQRFSTYWSIKDKVTDSAKQLIQLRAAHTIQIKGADEFFSELAEKVEALRNSDRPHPLSAKVAESQVKKYIAEPKYKIQLHDLCMQEIDKIITEVESRQLSVSINLSNEEIAKVVVDFEALCEIAISILCTGCIWGTKDHQTFWCKALERLANLPAGNISGGKRITSLRYYPAVILLYAGGVCAIANDQYETLVALLTGPTVREHDTTTPFPWGLYGRIWWGEPIKSTHGLERHYVPLSERLLNILREPLRKFVYDDSQYERFFNRFEYLQALAAAGQNKYGRPTLGRFMYKYNQFPDSSIITVVKEEIKSLKEQWPLFKAGFLGGSVTRFDEAAKRVEETIEKNYWF